MLDILSDGFKEAKQAFRGTTTLSEENLQTAIDKVRKSLLDADVEYSVAKDFIKKVKDKSLGVSVRLKAGKGSKKQKVSPADHFIKICQEELIALMGPVDSDLKFPQNKPAIIMMVGLQGSGKTTTTGKLTKFLQEKHKRKPLLVAADVYRPAAVDQLKVLAERVEVPVHSAADTSPVTICQQAIKKAFDESRDTVIIDTAGRLTIDEDLMQELVNIKDAVQPDHILFVCDSMMGQDAITTAKAFNERLDLSGVVMTKLDGDARGGAALSVKQITGKPIKFLGMGEDLDRLEEFRPEGLASRILGMGDVVGLMQDFERVADEDQEEKAMKMLKGQFTFKDFYEQISMIQKMGSLKDIAAKLPMQNMLPKNAEFDDKELTKIKAMIDSMTEKERTQPSIIDESRSKRIALGSGRSGKDVAELLTKFKAMHKMMSMVGKNMGLLGKIPGMNQLSQMSQLKKMAQAGGGMPGMPGMPGMGDMFGGGAAAAAKKPVDRDKLRKTRKAARKARKKNRKR